LEPSHEGASVILHHLGEITVRVIPYLQYQRTQSKMIPTGKRRRLNIDMGCFSTCLSPYTVAHSMQQSLPL
jgi:hypothetical protein